MSSSLLLTAEKIWNGVRPSNKIASHTSMPVPSKRLITQMFARWKRFSGSLLIKTHRELLFVMKFDSSFKRIWRKSCSVQEWCSWLQDRRALLWIFVRGAHSTSIRAQWPLSASCLCTVFLCIRVWDQGYHYLRVLLICRTFGCSLREHTDGLSGGWNLWR